VGDIFMSLIHTAELCGVQPFPYLVALLRYHEAAADDPAAWMPWNYQEALAALDPPHLMWRQPSAPCPGRAGRFCAVRHPTVTHASRKDTAKQLYKEGQYEQAAKLFSSLSSDHPELLVSRAISGPATTICAGPNQRYPTCVSICGGETDITPEIAARSRAGWLRWRSFVTISMPPRRGTCGAGVRASHGATPPPLAPAMPS